MSDPERPNPDPPEGGLFGKLPSTRPGVRSPRRDAGKTARKAEAKAKAVKPPADPPPAARQKPAGRAARPSPPPTEARSRPPRADPPRAEPPSEPERGDAPGVEDLAWAGITVAAEAATLGVKLLSRAVDAVRRPPDNR